MQKYFPSANVLMRDFQATFNQATIIRKIMRGKVCAFDPDLFPETHTLLSHVENYPPYPFIQMSAIAETLKLPLVQQGQILYINRGCIGKLTLIYDTRFRIASVLEAAA
jgi:hypothetical protein